MKRTLATALMVSVLGLAGCGLSGGLGPPNPAVGAQFTASVVGPKTVVLDGSASRADYYWWNLGDGTIVEGANLSIIGHTYDDHGVYVVSLEVQWGSGSSGSSSGCKVCPGHGGGKGGDADLSVTSRVVDLRGCETLYPAITMISFTGSVVPGGGTFLSWTKATFAATVPGAKHPVDSYVYRWTVTVLAYYRVNKNTVREETFTFLSADKNFTIQQIPASGSCGDVPFAEGTAKLEIWSPDGCYATVTVAFRVGP